jgi:quinol monooxygenase YgiN
VPSPETVYIFATITAAGGKADELRAVLAALVPEIRKEPGNISYELHENAAKPGEFHFYEAYSNEAAVQAHMANPLLHETFRNAGTLFVAPPVAIVTKRIA